ncbi:PD-(D/E)XK nuclease family protein [Pectobacterium jejuense]|uniref:PD-(D/E)XK nuclease family protein n=1 Tax=Pectobacterium TaxID=122277 RepID=UPI0032EC5D4C
MKITFSLHAGGWQGPATNSQLGEPILSPPAFLGLLEVQLGLSGPPVVSARRTAAFLVALRIADTPERFFHRSMQVDEMGTASALLAWRDQWFLAGWDGKPHDSWSGRLSDMAAVEAAVVGRIGLSEGERLALVAERLSKRRVPIAKVLVLEPISAFPARWRTVLKQLPIEIVSPQSPQAAGDLGAVQQRCLAAAVDGNLAPLDALTVDGSISVVRPFTVEVAEHWLANQYHMEPSAQRLIVCDEPAIGSSLDETLKATGVPTCGYSESSSLRPVVQALPLALETLWDPIEPARLLDFLMHPVGPLPSGIRRQLGRVFTTQPGIGGRAWTQVRNAIREGLEPDADRNVTEWLEAIRYDRRSGAPLELVVARIDSLRSSLQARLVRIIEEQGGGEADLRSAISQCSAVIDALYELRTSDNDLVKPRLLEQLVSQATSDAANTLATAEVGCMPSTSSIAACAVESADEVIWWMPDRPKLPTAHPWLQVELDALKDGGVDLLDPGTEMASMMTLWIRPILAARKRLVLILPPEGAELHPAWQLIHVVAPQLSISILEQDDVGKVAVTPQDLALSKGVWKFDPSAKWRETFPAPTRREVQSFSTLEVVFNNPALAVLQDAAYLRGSNMFAPAQDTRLLGTLAHRLVQLFLVDSSRLRWNPAQIEDWFGPAVNNLLTTEGMPLLALGNSMQLAQFKAVAMGGIISLLEYLNAAGVKRVETERPLSGSLGTLALQGDADLLLYLENDATAALDLKWSRGTRFRTKLVDGDFLQLALYAHMVEQETKVPPLAVGYFTFLDGSLSTLTEGVFGDSARVILPKSGETTVQLVQRALASWGWRVKQWQDGEVEVIGDGLEPGPSEPPDGCLPLRALGPWYLDFFRLFGQPESEA